MTRFSSARAHALLCLAAISSAAHAYQSDFETEQARANWQVVGNAGFDEGKNLQYRGSSNAWVRSTHDWNALQIQVPIDPSASTCHASAMLRTSDTLTDGYISVRQARESLVGDVIQEIKLVGARPAPNENGYRRESFDFQPNGSAEVLFYVGLWGKGADAWIQIDDVDVSCGAAAPSTFHRRIRKAPETTVDVEACLYEHADFGGWKFCTNALGLQEMTPRYRKALTSLRIPEGFLVNFYENIDGSGGACVYYGQVGQVSNECNDLASAFSFERDPKYQRPVAQTLPPPAPAPAAPPAAQEPPRTFGKNAVCLTSSDGSYFGTWSDLADSDFDCFDGPIQRSWVGDDMNDDIEMVYITSPWLEVTLYEHRDFQGGAVTLRCGTYELIDDPEDEVSSFKIRVLSKPEARCDQSERDVKRWD
jgi:hypothetical protein